MQFAAEFDAPIGGDIKASLGGRFMAYSPSPSTSPHVSGLRSSSSALAEQEKWAPLPSLPLCQSICLCICANWDLLWCVHRSDWFSRNLCCLLIVKWCVDSWLYSDRLNSWALWLCFFLLEPPAARHLSFVVILLSDWTFTDGIAVDKILSVDDSLCWSFHIETANSVEEFPLIILKSSFFPSFSFDK